MDPSLFRETRFGRARKEPHGKGGSILWVAQDVFDIVEAPMTYDR